MPTCWEPPNVDISNWAPWCRFFITDDDPTQYFVVDADLATPPAWITTVIRRKTAVFWCSENAGVTDLTADFEFPPMTTVEQAIALMGYDLVSPPLQFSAIESSPPDQGATA